MVGLVQAGAGSDSDRSTNGNGRNGFGSEVSLMRVVRVELGVRLEDVCVAWDADGIDEVETWVILFEPDVEVVVEVKGMN